MDYRIVLKINLLLYYTAAFNCFVENRLLLDVSLKKVFSGWYEYIFVYVYIYIYILYGSDLIPNDEVL